MKKIFLLLLVFVAGEMSAQGFKFGPKIGGVISDFAVHRNDTFNPGFKAGLFFEYGKGKWAGETGITMMFSNSVFDNLVTIPLDIKYYLYRGLFVKAGGSYGIGASVKVIYDDIVYSSSQLQVVNLNAGVGYKLSERISLDLFYERSVWCNFTKDNSVLGISLNWNILKVK
ncbi:MAG: outer membrane beta-barrel protein [Bacteroidales bacterium]|nr:outer membrane beta-barrel protein [Bacteroidales bacterium]